MLLLQVNETPPYFDLNFCHLDENKWIVDSEGGTGEERPEQFRAWLEGREG